MPRRIDHHGRSSQKIVIYDGLRDLAARSPGTLRACTSRRRSKTRSRISLVVAARSAGAGCRCGRRAHKHYFAAQRYCGLDLAVGDKAWDYSKLDVLGDLETLPFPDDTFEACYQHRDTGTRAAIPIV